MKTTDIILNNRTKMKIKHRSKHYFFLLKENQLFVYNFYSWRLIIKNQDIWVNILINRILGIIPVWIIKVHGNIKAYRIAHPWKYKGIKFLIFTFMKLIGLGFLLPYYGVVKGIHFFSKLRSLLSGEFTWKKIFFVAGAGLSGVLLYNNFFCIIAQCSEEKFDFVKAQSDLASTSKKLVKVKSDWAPIDLGPTQADFWKKNISRPNLGFDFNYVQEASDFKKSQTENIKEELEITKEKLVVSNSELESTKEKLEFTKERLESKKEKLEFTKEKLESKKEAFNSINSELKNTSAELAAIREDWGYTKLDLVEAKADLGSAEEDLYNTQEKWISTKAELEKTKEELTSTKVELDSIKEDLISTQKTLAKTSWLWEKIGAIINTTLFFKEKELASTKAELASTKEALWNSQFAYGYTKAELIITQADLDYTEENLVKKV